MRKSPCSVRWERVSCASRKRRGASAQPARWRKTWGWRTNSSVPGEPRKPSGMKIPSGAQQWSDYSPFFIQWNGLEPCEHLFGHWKRGFRCESTGFDIRAFSLREYPSTLVIQRWTTFIEWEKALSLCICSMCPSYTVYGEDIAYCVTVKGKSLCITDEKGCPCPGSPVLEVIGNNHGSQHRIHGRPGRGCAEGAWSVL